MKKLFAFFSLVFVLFCTPLSTLHAEEITSFQSVITIQTDGQLAVEETITYNFESEKKHGILRIIPFKKTNSEGKQFIVDFHSFSVFDSNKNPYPFTVSKNTDNHTIKIGDPNIFVSGEQTYTIRYQVSGAITYFSDHDELYWNNIGTDGTVPILSMKVNIQLPEEVSPEEVRMECFVGEKNSTNSDCSLSFAESVFSFQSSSLLSPGMGMTIVAGFPKNLVAVLEPTPVNTWFSQVILFFVTIISIVAAIVWYLILPIWIVIHWFKTGRDPKPPMGVASAWFDIPKTKSLRGLTPGETGALVDEQVDMRDITGTIIDLARRGYIKIVEKKKNDFYLEKMSHAKKGDTFEQFEKTLYEGIFSEKDSVRIKEANFIEPVNQAKKQLYEALVKENFFSSNPESIRIKYTVLGVFGIVTMNFPLSLSAFIFGRAMPKKTMQGAQSAAVSLSLKNFITSQDRQYAYQAKNQLFFEKFLPYAIVFGVEKIWAERFKDIKLTKPDWYEGYDARTFNSIFFVHSLNSSLHSVASVATPTSSSSGFSSGFSGGSVGGGGGGGSVGSW
jgi:uncharacterized membrane protein